MIYKYLGVFGSVSFFIIFAGNEDIMNNKFSIEALSVEHAIANYYGINVERYVWTQKKVPL